MSNYLYDDEDNEPMNDHAYDYLRYLHMAKGGDKDGMREREVQVPELVQRGGHNGSV